MSSRAWATFVAAAATSTAVLAGSSAGRAQESDEKLACVDAHVRAQRLRNANQLLAAKQALIDCSRTACPQVLVAECGAWLKEVADLVPSIVVSAVGPDGRDVVGVRIAVDGRAVTQPVAGAPIELDPGEHVFHFELPGAAVVDERVVVRVGEKNRTLLVRFAAAHSEAPPPRPPIESRPIPAAAWVFGGIGIVGAGAFAAFGVLGLSRKGDLDDAGCKPKCPPDDVTYIQRSFLIGDISLGVAVVSFAVATYLIATRPARSPRPIARRPVVGGF